MLRLTYDTAAAQQGIDAQWLFAQFLPATGPPAEAAGKAGACCRA